MLVCAVCTDVLYNAPLGVAVANRVKEAADRGNWVIVVSAERYSFALYFIELISLNSAMLGFAELC